MKKAVKVIMAVIAGLVGIFFTSGAIYDFLGLVWNSQKNHGWQHITKAEKKTTPWMTRLKNRAEATEDVMEDVKAGWRWRMEK